jgi:hypothetical protein
VTCESCGMSDPTDPRDPASYSGYANPSDQAPTPPASGAVYPPPQPSYQAPPTQEPVLVTIGDMSVTQFHVITPNGTHPLNGTSWYVTDNSTYEQAIPQWAIIVAIIGFFVVCFFSLLFLLVKETKSSGFVQVTVQGQGWAHVTQLPAGTAATAHAQAAYVRNLVAALPA